MTLQEILNEVNLLVPNELTNEEKVRKINQIQRQLSRKFLLPEKVYRFESTPESPYYDLPADCSEDRVQNVIVGEQRYQLSTFDEEYPPDYFYMFIAGSLYIHPNPMDVKEIFLFYRPRHVELSANNLSAIPNFPEDYHELLVYGCAKWVASIQRDVDMVNNMQAEYDEVLRDAERQFKKYRAKTVRITQSWV